MNRPVLDPDFANALAQAGLDIPPDRAERLEAYARILWRWNEKLNLTRHTDWNLFVGRDLRDCMHLAPLLETGEEVLDLGSGGGVPGIPLAILRPDIHVSLAESVGKRAAVLNDIVQELNLPVPVYAARGEELLQDFRFDTIVSRAVGSIAKFCNWIQPHWPSVGRLLLIKGPRWVEERGEARHTGALQGLHLRRAASYPLGDGPLGDGPQGDGPQGDGPQGERPPREQPPGDGQNEGVILQIWPDRGAS